MSEKVYLTRYALTDGIKTCLASSSDLRKAEEDKGYLILNDQEWRFTAMARKDWYRTWGSALKRAEQMRATKIASLERQIARIKSIEFGDKA